MNLSLRPWFFQLYGGLRDGLQDVIQPIGGLPLGERHGARENSAGLISPAEMNSGDERMGDCVKLAAVIGISIIATPLILTRALISVKNRGTSTQIRPFGSYMCSRRNH